MSVFDRPDTEDVAVRQRRAAARRSLLMPAAVASVLGASAGLSHAFTTLGFLPLSMALVALAFALGWLSRRLAVPGVLAPFVSFVGLAVVVGWVYAGETTTYGLPTGDTARKIGDILSRALDDVRVLAAPVEINPDLRLLTAAGVFAVAVVVDIIVFRLRRPAVAGLPLLALYIIPTSVRDEAPGMVPFALAAAGYVTLLIAEGRDRAKGWGRRLAGRDVVEELVDVSPVSRVGRRLGAAAVCLAVAVPLFVPDLGDGFLGPGVGGGGTGIGDGPSSREVINPIVELAPQLRNPDSTPLLSVRTNRPDYLRLTSLDLYEADRRGERWKQSALSAPAEKRVNEKRLPRPPGAGDVELLDTKLEVDVRNLDVPWLPAPYAPSYVEVDGDWRYDEQSMTVFSARQTTRRLSYTVESKVPAPTTDLLSGTFDASQALDRYRELPDGELSPVVQRVLDRELRGATAPFEQALALQRYFRETGGFVYDLNVNPGQTRNQLDAFLTNKRGYCEQFAATFAYLMRALDAPARVAIGFTPGTLQDDGSYLITNREAHAWPEVYFANVGWIRFEPTPRNDDVRTIPPDYAAPAAPGPGGETPTAEPTASAEPSPTTSASGGPIREPSERPDSGGAAGPGGADGDQGVPWRLVLAATLGLLAAAAPATTRQAIRWRRHTAAEDPIAMANAAWADLADDAEDLGFPMRRSDSPRQAAARLNADAELSGLPAKALTMLGRAEERARYAPTPPSPEGLAEEVRAVRRALSSAQRWPVRLRAMVLPPSTMRRARTSARSLGHRSADAFAAATEAVASRMPARLRGDHRHAG
jgi:hypothetical protein